MDPNQKLMADQGEPHSDLGRYRKLVGKLIYLAITRPGISFSVTVVSQFMLAPHLDHWKAVTCILKYIKKGSRTRIVIGGQRKYPNIWEL